MDGDTEIVEMLVRYGKDLTTPDSYRWTTVHLIVWNMHIDMVIFLLEVAVQMKWMSSQNEDCLSTLHLAIYWGRGTSFCDWKKIYFLGSITIAVVVTFLCAV